MIQYFWAVYALGVALALACVFHGMMYSDIWTNNGQSSELIGIVYFLGGIAFLPIVNYFCWVIYLIGFIHQSRSYHKRFPPSRLAT